ncbi:MAG: alpha/beta hydrolase [Phormidesmis sp.]
MVSRAAAGQPVGPVKFLPNKNVAPDKPLFIFLPGMDGSGRLFRPQESRLMPWFDVRCVSIALTDKSSWTRLARKVGELIRSELSALNTNGRRRAVYLCGESFGGCLAMHVLTQSPELFERIVLVNPASSFRRLPWMHLGSLITRRLPSQAYQFSSLGMVPLLIEQHRVSQRDRQDMTTAMSAVSARTAAWRMKLLSEFEAERLPLERMMHPVLLIAGANDRLLPSTREVKSLLRRFPNSQMKVLPYSGHACLLERETNLQKILFESGFLPS